MRARDQVKYFFPLVLVINCILYFAFIPLANQIAPGIFITNLMAPDSPGYIDFSPSRTAFYPAFLSAVHLLFKTYDVVPILQLMIFSIAVSSLCANIRLLFNSRLISWILFGALILNPAIFKFHLQILTESLSLSIFCGVLATVARFCRTKNSSNLGWAMILASLGAGVRPSNYPLIIAVGIFILTVWRLGQINYKGVAKSLAPAPLILLLAAGLFYIKHGEFKTQSFLGHNLYGKVIVYTDETIQTQSPKSTKAMAELFAPIKSIINGNKLSPVLFNLLDPLYDIARYEELQTPSHTKLIFDDIQNRYPEITDDYLMERSTEIIKAFPALYAKDVALNFIALWQLWFITTPAEQAEIKTLLNHIDISPLYTQILLNKLKTMPTGFVLIVRFILAILFINSLIYSLFFFISPARLSNQKIFLAFTALTINGTYLLIALTQAGLARYAMSMWPGVIILALNLYLNPFKKETND